MAAVVPWMFMSAGGWNGVGMLAQVIFNLFLTECEQCFNGLAPFRQHLVFTLQNVEF